MQGKAHIFAAFEISRFELYGCELHSEWLRNRAITVFDVIEPRAYRTDVQQCQDYLMR